MSTIQSLSSRASGSRVLPRQSVTVLSDPVRVGDAPTSGQSVEIELIREGNVTREIRVRCPCGQTIVLECGYETNTTAESQESSHV